MSETTQVRSHRELSLQETLLVLLAAALLGGAGYGGRLLYLDWELHREVEVAWPIMMDAARLQREAIVAAIETYHSHFGFYPPDHVVSRQPLRVEPVTNSLLYELGGTTYDAVKKTFANPRVDHVTRAALQETYQIDAFTNAVAPSEPLREFLALDGFGFSGLHDDPDLVALKLPIFVDAVTENAASEFAGSSSWHYVTTGATHNPGRFDLWMILRTDRREVIIGNWPAAQ